MYPSPIFNPPAIVDTLIAEQCSALHGVPTHFIGVLSEIEKRENATGESLKFDRLRQVYAYDTKNGAANRLL